MKYKKIYIKWEDACSEDAWINFEDIQDETPIIHTVGWLFLENDKAYVIGLNYDDSNHKVSQTILIPKSFVKEIVIIENILP